MIKNSSDISFEKWRKEVSELFLFSEKDLISNDENILDDYSYYSDYLSSIIYHSALILNLSFETSLIIYKVIEYLLKSTLYFDYSILEDMNTINSKKALIYGDLYLLQGGIEFRKLDNYKKILNLLKKTLYSISLSQNIESRLKNYEIANLEKIIKLRYGSIFKLAFTIPYAIKKINFNKREINKLLNYNAINISLENNRYLLSKYKNDEILIYKEKIRNYLEKNKEKGDKLIECNYS